MHCSFKAALREEIIYMDQYFPEVDRESYSYSNILVVYTTTGYAIIQPRWTTILRGYIAIGLITSLWFDY